MMSGRKIATVSCIVTFCIVFSGLTVALIFNRLDGKTYAGFFAAFTVVVGKVVDFYFMKKRNGE